MSDTIVHLNFNGPRNSAGQKKQPSNDRHRQFARKRRYLEQKGYLNAKQNRTNCQQERNKQNHAYKRKVVDHQPNGAVFPKFTTSQSDFCTSPSSSAQTPHGRSIREPVVPLKSTPSRESGLLVLPPLDRPHKCVAIDCEMVGTGPKGHCSELARCSIISYDGDVIYDQFIKPVNPVTDLRTRWSGVRWKDLVNARPFKQAQKEILKILSGKLVVGHALQNDFKALQYTHPTCLVRDTSRIPILNQKAGLPEKQIASLKTLTKILFNKDIQVGKKGHSSVEDAAASMELYKLVEVKWEKMLSVKPADMFTTKTG